MSTHSPPIHPHRKRTCCGCAIFHLVRQDHQSHHHGQRKPTPPFLPNPAKTTPTPVSHSTPLILVPGSGTCSRPQEPNIPPYLYPQRKQQQQQQRVSAAHPSPPSSLPRPRKPQPRCVDQNAPDLTTSSHILAAIAPRRCSRDDRLTTGEMNGRKPPPPAQRARAPGRTRRPRSHLKRGAAPARDQTCTSLPIHLHGRRW